MRLGSYFSAAMTISCGKAASIRIRSISEGSVLSLIHILDKVVYLADMTSKERDWPGVGKLRKLEMNDLDAAMLAALKQTNEFVLSQGKPLDPQSAAAYEDILARQKKEC